MDTGTREPNIKRSAEGPEGISRMAVKVVKFLKALIRWNLESYGKLGNWSTWIISFLAAAGFLGIVALFIQ